MASETVRKKYPFELRDVSERDSSETLRAQLSFIEMQKPRLRLPLSQKIFMGLAGGVLHMPTRQGCLEMTK